MFKNIILHWTAGSYYPNKTDVLHYHFLIDKDGTVYPGTYSPSDNLNCTDGKYAAHCGGGNTGRIGIAICCRKDFSTQPTRVQLEKLYSECARLCKVYGLKPNDCITHAEFGQSHPKTSSYGKIDINYLPSCATDCGDINGIKNCGDYIRNKIFYYYQKQK